MTYRIAITGKGGSGKTTLAALIVLGLIKRGRRPVLAVDADPNMCLDAALGVTVERTVGSIREDARRMAGVLMRSACGILRPGVSFPKGTGEECAYDWSRSGAA